MNAHYISMYFEIKLDDVLNILNDLKTKEKLKPVFSSLDYGMEYYLRGDIWNLYDVFMQVIKMKYPKSTRLKLRKTLVDISDVICYYGISRASITHSILPKLKPKVIHTGNNRQSFYLLDDFLELKEHSLFKTAVENSRYSFTAYTLDKQPKIKKQKYFRKYDVEHRDSDEIFRDTSCTCYDNCSTFAATSTDYMDCTLCYHYLKRRKISPPEIFDPKTVFIRKNTKRIEKMFEKICSFPNSL